MISRRAGGYAVCPVGRRRLPVDGRSQERSAASRLRMSALLRSAGHAPGQFALSRGFLLLRPALLSIRVYEYSRSRDCADSRILGCMDLDRPVPVWPQVAEELRRRLDAGQYPAGGRFPAVNELAAELDVAPSTVQKAVAALRAEGRLYTVLGQGSFVKGDE
ncbi:predicted protein [Streptomyces viridosporus ATCC 14672]|uniref:Predicted protein n=2 Tax=Streptomyces viridosporus TaxID=67581 RepID=D5ZZD1_STRV1|nr:predicted protein [Streptomyces viridosporus ATCC 14672]